MSTSAVAFFGACMGFVIGYAVRSAEFRGRIMDAWSNGKAVGVKQERHRQDLENKMRGTR